MSEKMNRRSLILTASALSLSACLSGPNASGDGEPNRVVGDYRLGSGDKIRISVYGEEELSGEFLVNGSGVVSVPLAGEIVALDKTTQELQQAVEGALRGGYLLNPQVSIEVLTYRPFYILGEVRTPGTYPYASGLTILNAVATAGGFTYRADTRRVFIRDAGGAEERAFLVTATTQVAPGDTIRIAERLF